MPKYRVEFTIKQMRDTVDVEAPNTYIAGTKAIAHVFRSYDKDSIEDDVKIEQVTELSDEINLAS